MEPIVLGNLLYNYLESYQPSRKNQRRAHRHSYSTGTVDATSASFISAQTWREYKKINRWVILCSSWMQKLRCFCYFATACFQCCFACLLLSWYLSMCFWPIHYSVIPSIIDVPTVISHSTHLLLSKIVIRLISHFWCRERGHYPSWTSSQNKRRCLIMTRRLRTRSIWHLLE